MEETTSPIFLSQEKFPVEYGPTFDKELEKLMWEFLIRLDQLLPVPSLAQVHSVLSLSENNSHWFVTNSNQTIVSVTELVLLHYFSQ